MKTKKLLLSCVQVVVFIIDTVQNRRKRFIEYSQLYYDFADNKLIIINNYILMLMFFC